MTTPDPLVPAPPVAGPDWLWPSLALGGVVLLGLLAWIIVRFVREMGRTSTALARTAGDSAVRVAETIAGAFRATLNLDPRIRIDGVTLTEGVAPARELVMAKQVLTRTHAWTNTRLWSTKKLTLTATFSVRAGFDLGQPIEIDLDRDGAGARVRWPAPRILSVQIETLQPAAEETGWWNRITPEDRAAVQREMQRMVEQDAAESGLLARAEAELRQLLLDQARPSGTVLQIRFDAPPASSPPAATDLEPS